ncbi:DnrP protein [Pseudomonas indica]|uniref:DnrP protein n=1 Tax=Pseudomonas indica TaxID=137658 RepID=UPI000BABCED1|nr:DnrP protein [Pseudomonas indica]PAU63595.1 DnrP protein [Pseudomonas indica]
MANCLYCGEEHPAGTIACRRCGMPLPVRTDGAAARRQRRFLWFCIGLALFCAAMIVWLPRSLS